MNRLFLFDILFLFLPSSVPASNGAFSDRVHIIWPGRSNIGLGHIIHGNGIPLKRDSSLFSNFYKILNLFQKRRFHHAKKTQIFCS
jgi:hypothetical protein